MIDNNYFLPVKLNVYLTTNCDYNCDYCFFSEKNILNKQTLSKNAIDTILKNIVKYRVPLVSLNGGDPFIFQDLPLLISHITKNKTYCIVGGNATHFTKEYCKELKKAGLRFLQIGMDSISVHKNKNYKEENYTNRVITATKNLRQEGINFSIATCITAKNYMELSQIKQFSKDIGAQHLKISFYDGNNNSYILTRKKYQGILKNIDEINLSDSEFIKYFESDSIYKPKYPTLTIYSNGDLAIEENGDILGNIYISKDLGKIYFNYLNERNLL